MDKITSNLPRIKNALHGLQAFCILVAGILDIVFLVKGEQSGGAIIFYLVLCFISMPAIVYNSMTLWFERSRAWGNAYAFAILDLLFCIIWLAAFASVAAFNGTGKCNPACGVAKAMVGFGFFIFLFFALTTAISIHNALYYRAHGSMPLSNQRMAPSSIDPDRDAFSTAPHDLYAPIGGDGHDDDDDRDGTFAHHRRASNDLYSGGAPMEGGRYGLPSYHAGSDNGKDDGDHLGRFDHEIGGAGRASAMGGRNSAMGGRASAMSHTMPYGPDSYQDTSYGGATAYAPPRVEDEEMGAGGRVHFPAAPYGA